MKLRFTLSALAVVFGAILAMNAQPTNAAGGADISYSTGECGATTFTATGLVSSPANMYLVVSVNGETQSTNIPIAGNGSVTIDTDPIYTPDGASQTVQWHVFGGGERDYDDPLWNGYGTVSFGADIAAYAASQGGSYSWVISGPNDPNPFVTWNSFVVDSCATDPQSKEECKDGGWESFGFSNQGQCIRFVNTGKDSR